MIRRRIGYISTALLLAVGLAAAEAQAATIAHWSFDSGAITTDAGDGHILTAADSTGNHHATTTIAGTGATINPIAGVFGGAADFTNLIGNQGTNNAWMSIPQLTEIAGASGGSFTVAAWARLAASNTTDDNTILADWGNAPANTRRFTYWFELDNADSNANARPRGQLRAANDLNDGVNETNIDIIATTVGASNAAGVADLADDMWHHLAWSWDKPQGKMRFYIDGVLAQVATTAQTGANKDILISDSLVGAIGGKRDNNRYYTGDLDELWVIAHALRGPGVNLLRTENIAVPEPAALVLLMFAAAAVGAVTGRWQAK